jgi:hypothetical protein
MQYVAATEQKHILRAAAAKFLNIIQINDFQASSVELHASDAALRIQNS